MNWTTLNRTIAPVARPITIEEAKGHLKVALDFVDDDALIESYIESATMWAEKFCNRVFCEQTWAMKLPGFPSTCSANGRIELPKPPLRSVTSITYVDAAGAPQTLSGSVYAAQSDDYGAFIELAYSQSWPSTRSQSDAVIVTFLAGYAKTGAGTEGDPYNYRANVPGPIKEALKRKVQHSYDNLRPEDADALQVHVAQLLWPYKLVTI